MRNTQTGGRFSIFFNQAPMTMSILLLNVVMYLLTVIFGGGNLWNGGSTSTLIQFGAQYGPMVSRGEWYRLVTANFLHGGLMHIFFNSYALFYFGFVVEKIYTSPKFISVYLLTGVAGNLLTQLFYTDVPSVGASGAIFGLVGLLFAAGISGRMRGRLGGFAGTALLPMILINLFLGFSVPGINNLAHIGGLAAGFGMGMILTPGPSFKLKQRQLWMVAQYLCVILIVLSLILNFVNISPSVDRVISFHNTYVQLLSDITRSSDSGQYAYYLNLLNPFDSTTRRLKENAQDYIESGGTSPSFNQLSREFKDWQSEVLEKYDLQLRSE